MMINHYLEDRAGGLELAKSDQGGRQTFWAGGNLSLSSAFVSR